MEEAGQWRKIYFIPAIIGLVTSFIAIFTAKETDSFMESRVEYLRMSKEERELKKRLEEGY